MSSRVRLLQHLEEFANATEAGHTELKSSVWQLTKVRRRQIRGSLTMEDTFSAEQVREDLRAGTMVANVHEMDTPDLVEDNHEATNTKDGPKVPSWKIVTAQTESNKTEKDSSDLVGGNDKTDNSSGGLRQRKKTGNTSAKDSLAAQAESKMTQDPPVNPEEVLRKRDPLELFPGVRPAELKLAQTHAKQALDSYIVAANQAAAILAFIEASQKKK